MKNLDIYRDAGSVEMGLIEAFEQKIGYCFPSSYKKLISEHNNLYPEQDSFDFINELGEKEEAGIAFYGYGEWPIESIEKAQHTDIYGFDEVITFGRRANGDYICFDYRDDPKTCEPGIVLMRHDDYTEDAEGNNPKMVVINIAPNFEAFIDLLYKYEDEDE